VLKPAKILDKEYLLISTEAEPREKTQGWGRKEKCRKRNCSPIAWYIRLPYRNQIKEVQLIPTETQTSVHGQEDHPVLHNLVSLRIKRNEGSHVKYVHCHIVWCFTPALYYHTYTFLKPRNCANAVDAYESVDKWTGEKRINN
jgi:hypothetical protein